MSNRMQITFSAIPENESLARMAVSAFILPVDPTLEQMSDVKTAVSEAVTNSIIHGYPSGNGTVCLTVDVVEPFGEPDKFVDPFKNAESHGAYGLCKDLADVCLG